jgi:hypothetical protein
LIVVLTQVRSPADGIGFGERADIEHDGSLFLFCDNNKDAPSGGRVQVERPTGMEEAGRRTCDRRKNNVGASLLAMGHDIQH